MSQGLFTHIITGCISLKLQLRVIFPLVSAQFVPGQRWISNTEAELGLGIIVNFSARRVTINFPAAGEERIYAADSAPLSRVEYPVGETVSHADGTKMVIKDRIFKNELWIYQGIAETGEELIIPEMQLDHAVHFSRPQDRLFTGQIEKHSKFQLRVETLNHQHRNQASEVQGLLGPRVQLLPHQLYIAHQVSQRHAPRVLLADEVGLGKTIEAGMILHQQLISGRSQRVLIVVPDSLIHQWLVEMIRRFNFMFTILDDERCVALEESGVENPFDSTQLALCSLSFLTGNQHRFEQATDVYWDLLIVDEAHHLEWSPTEPSREYQAIETLAKLTPGLLLLTATPEQLGLESHFARLRLLDPDRYHSIEAFSEEEASYRPISDLVEQLLDPEERAVFDQYSPLMRAVSDWLGEESSQHIIETLAEGDTEAAIDGAIEQLLDRHGTGRVLFRNTRDGVSGFPGRKLHPHPLPMPDSYRVLLDEGNVLALLQPETAQPDTAFTDDPRIDWLESWLSELEGEKALVICHRAETAIKLEKYLRLICGMKSSVFHEGMTLVARDRAAAYFADDEDAAQVLICSEIGSEGRNFQFASHIVMYDLPLNPDLLEQRIGRLDRIGQRNTVNVHVPFLKGSAQDVLMQWYHHGVNAFERANPAGMVIQAEVQEALDYCLRHPSDAMAVSGLIDQTHSITEDMLETLQQGRNRLLEYNSCHPTKANDIVESVAHAGSQLELARYMEKMLDQFGVEQQHHSVNSVILHHGDHMLCPIPTLPEDGLTATYQRELALSREDMHFFTWEHPMVTGMMDIVLTGDFGNTAFGAINHPQIKPGELILEAIFTAHCPAPKQLQIPRFLPHSAMRLLVDSKGRNISKGLKHSDLNNMVERVPKHVARQMIKAARDRINQLVDHAETIASSNQTVLIQMSLDNMQKNQQAEIDRLTALAQVNPSIRESEIEHLKAQTQILSEAIDKIQFRLDAVRVLIST